MPLWTLTGQDGLALLAHRDNIPKFNLQFCREQEHSDNGGEGDAYLGPVMPVTLTLNTRHNLTFSALTTSALFYVFDYCHSITPEFPEPLTQLESNPAQARGC